MKKKTGAKKSGEAGKTGAAISRAKKADAAKRLIPSIMQIIGALVLLYFSVALRNHKLDFFYTFDTAKFEAQVIAEDFATVGELFTVYIKTFAGLYARDYLVTAYVFLLPAIILAALGISGILPGLDFKKWSFSTFLKRRETAMVLAMAVLAFLVTLGIHYFVFRDFPLFSDEFSYLFQGDLLSAGRLFAQSPPMPEFYQYDNMICDGKWYSKYTLGWPLLLAVGKLVSLPGIINPICAALTVIFLYFICKKLSGRRAGVICGLLAIFSPIFLFQGASYFPHTSFGLAALIILYGLLKLEEDRKFLYSAGAGLALAMAINIRTADAAVLLAGAAPFAGYLIYKSKDRAFLLKRLALIFVLFLMGAGVLLAVNYYQNGDPFLLGYNKYSPEDKWGFGPYGHTPVRALWITSFSLMRLSFWSAPFLGLLAAISFRRRKPIPIFLAIIILAYTLFNFGLYGFGRVGFGPRLFYQAFILLIIIATCGLVRCCAILEKRQKLRGNVLAAAFIIGCFIYLSFGFYPPVVSRLQKFCLSARDLYQSYSDPPEFPGKLITFVGSSPDAVNTAFIRNNWRYNSERNIIALFLTPEQNRQLMEIFKDRKPLVGSWDSQKDRLVLRPYNNYTPQPEDYYIAAKSYQTMPYSYKKKAMEIFERLYAMKPGNVVVQSYMAEYFFRNDAYEKAAEIYKTLIDKDPDNPNFDGNYFFYARSLWKLGKKKEAIETLEKLLEKFPNTKIRPQATNWLEFYEKAK